MPKDLLEAIEIPDQTSPTALEILTPKALNFITLLHQEFNETRKKYLKLRKERQLRINEGEKFNFLTETSHIRNDPNWRVRKAPSDLIKRRVEITGPVERKMMINALNSCADIFMADFEDALSPTWKNVLEGQINLKHAINQTISFVSAEGKQYALNPSIATLMVRPRSWHLDEKHLLINKEPISASLFDFGLYFFHNAQNLIERGTGPYFYLPKLESHLEARLWKNIFVMAEKTLNIPEKSICATVLIETLPAAFEMEEILYELRDYSAGLNAGRWDYIFSIIKKFQLTNELKFPDRSQITMQVPFMHSYSELLVKSCHRRGAHAIGGMSAFIPSKKDAEINQRAFEKVREDKLQEVHAAFDGTWVAHPDLVPLAMEIFEKVLNGKPNQLSKLKEKVEIKAEDLLNFEIKGGKITEHGLKQNICVALLYLQSWLNGNGAVALFNLMEDAATAEISRAQVWQWIHHSAYFDNGKPITLNLCQNLINEVLASFGQMNKLDIAKKLFENLISKKEFDDFLTTSAYAELT